MSLDLEDLAGGVRDNGDQLELDVPRVHVQGEVVRQDLLLAGGDGDLVAHGSQVSEDGSVMRRVGGQFLSVQEHASDNSDLDGAILVVGDLNQRLGGPAVDELDAEDVRLGEGCRDVRLQVRLGRDLRVCLESRVVLATTIRRNKVRKSPEFGPLPRGMRRAIDIHLLVRRQ